MIIKLTRAIRRHVMGLLPLSKNSMGLIRIVMPLLMLMLTHSSLAQTVSVSPTDWTDTQSSITYNGYTYRKTTNDGSTWMQVRAYVKSENKVAVYVKKNSGNFLYPSDVYLYRDINTSTEALVEEGNISAGTPATYFDITPASGTHKYTFLVISHGTETIRYCTYPITVTYSSGEATISAPSVITKDATNVTSTSATLNGTVNPNGAATGCEFWWGTSNLSLDNYTEVQHLAAGTSSVTVTAELTGLSPNTTYCFKLKANNVGGVDQGVPKYFTTEEEATPSAPSVITMDATNVTSTSATLKGTVNPNGAATGCEFWWGTSNLSLDNYTEVQHLAAGTSIVTVTAELTGLSPNTTYCFKLKANNIGGVDQGVPKYFTTLEASSPGGENELEDAVTYLHSKGIVDGSTPEAAETGEQLLRQQLAKIAFYGVYGGPSKVPSLIPSDNFPTVYGDLTESNSGNEYYFRPARALLYLEYGDGVTPFDRNRLEFDPEGKIARVHVLKVLMEAFNIQPNMTGTSNPFPNDDDVVALAGRDPRMMGYIREAYNRGIINNQISTWRPTAYCTRGEAFLLLYRIMTNVSTSKPGDSDYFQPLNTTLKTLSMRPGLQMGNFQHYTKTSFALDGVVPLGFSHTYNSYNTTLSSIFSAEHSVDNVKVSYLPLADGWSHTYHTYIVLAKSSSSTTHAIVHWGGGGITVYEKNGTAYEPTSLGVYDELSRESSSSLVIKTKSQMEYHFSVNQSFSECNIFYLSSIKDRNGNTLTINYATGANGMKRISSVSDGHGRTLTFSYKSGTDLISSVSDNSNNRTIQFGYTFNSRTQRYQLKNFTDARNNKTYYEYVDDSRMSTSKLLAGIKLPNGNYITNQYDASNHRLTRTENGESTTTIEVTPEYGSSGASASTDSKVSITRSSGTSTYNYQFNGNNVMTGMTGPKSLSVSVTPYNTTGKQHLAKSVTTNSTNVSNIEYDGKGNVTRIDVTADGKTQTTRYEYNDMNDVTKVTDPMGYVTNYTYNTSGNLTKIQSPVSSVYTQISRLSNGLPSQVKNAEGVTADYSYDSYGNLNRVTLPGSIVTVPAFDAAGRLTSITDALGNTYTYGYDANDNMTSTKDPDNNTTRFDYDDNDNLTSITNAKGGVTSMSYDFDTDRLTSVSFAGSTKEYEYNADGTLDTYTKPDGTTLGYSYDNLGRITSDGVNSYSYDSKMRLSSISDDNRTLSLSYDGFNRITGTDCDGHSNSYSYDNNGNCLSVNGTSYGYDRLNRLTSVSFNNRTITYTYRNDSQLWKVDYDGVMTTTYGYDSAGRLTSKSTKLSNGTVIAAYTYTLDKAGNIKSQTVQEPYDGIVLTNEDVSYSYNSGNRITKAGSINFSFDANGNTTKRGGESYIWDEKDRLTKAGGTNIEYDPLGLIARYGDIEFTTDPLGIGNVLSDSRSGATYIYGNGLEARVVGSKVGYYVTDVRGSVVAIVDEGGNITHKYQYDEFGKVTQKEEPAGNANYNPFQYVGKYGVMYLNDHQYYMRARHYDPTIGRFLSEDPIWSTNLYPYVENNPIMKIDPRGLESIDEQIANLDKDYEHNYNYVKQLWNEGRICDGDFQRYMEIQTNLWNAYVAKHNELMEIKIKEERMANNSVQTNANNTPPVQEEQPVLIKVEPYKGEPVQINLKKGQPTVKVNNNQVTENNTQSKNGPPADASKSIDWTIWGYLKSWNEGRKQVNNAYKTAKNNGLLRVL